LTERVTDIKDTDSAGSPSRKAPSEAATRAQATSAYPAPFKIRRRIGSTVYEVDVCFSPGADETMDDKILRLVRGEAVKSDTEGRK
jgi:hypothetical protein